MKLPPGYFIRTCRRDELEVWRAMPFDKPSDARQHAGLMNEYVRDVYAPEGDMFFQTCLFVCHRNDTPVATGILWKTLRAFTTLQWLKVRKTHEGKGIGRALLTRMLTGLHSDEYPIYLYTQPGSFRAIKLNADFGFRLLTNPKIGICENHLLRARPYLARKMPRRFYDRLLETAAPVSFLDCVRDETQPQF